MAILKLYKLSGEPPEEVEVSDCLFEERIDTDLLHRVVRYQLAKLRQGTASTKTRGEVRGGGRKPWRQKGTGRARHGSIRSPLWRGGGVVFGPKPRDFSIKLPKKMRRKGLRMALTAKLREGQLHLADRLEFPQPKTKEGLKLLERWGFDGSKSESRSKSESESENEGAQGKLLILVSREENTIPVRKTFSNLPWVECLPATGANVYDLLKYEHLLITQAALRELEERVCR